MDFNFTEDQDQLRAAVSGYVERHNAFPARTSASRAGTGFNETLWQGLASDLGILGAAIPESDGGFGGTPVDLMVIMEELGANLLVEPYLETAILAAFLLNVAGGQGAELHAIATGSARYGFAWAEPNGRYTPLPRETCADEQDGKWLLKGAKAVVSGAPWATKLLVSAVTPQGPGVFLVDPAEPGVTLSPYPTIDGRQAADVHFSDVSLERAALLIVGEQAQTAIESALDLAATMTGARALGVMRRLLDMTVDYTLQRKQFGKAIAEFQVLQHHMVDMYMQLELATSAVYRAVLSLDAPAAERGMAVSAMKVTVGEACRFVGQGAIQLHGGMGMTDEMAVSHYFRAATAIESEYGTADFHLNRFAKLAGQQGA